MSKNVSNNFKNIIKSGGPFYAYATVKLVDGTTFTLDSETDFFATGNSYSEDAGDGFPLGSALSKQISIHLDNHDERFSNYDFYGAEIVLYTEADIPGGTTERILEGTFTVIDSVAPGDVLDITAYDDMYKLDSDFISNLIYPATLQQLWNELCDYFDVSNGSPQFKNNDFIVQTKPDGATGREMAGYIAQIAVGNAVADANGRLCIKSYDFSQFNESETVVPGEIETAYGVHILSEFMSDPNIGTDNVVITGITTSITDDAGETSSIVYGDDAYAIFIDNPLILGKEQAAMALIGDELIGLSVRPFSGDFVPNPTIEVMDPVYIVDKKDNVYKSFVTSHGFTYLGFSDVANNLESPQRNRSTYSNNVSKIYQHVSQQLNNQKTQWETAVEDLQDELKNASGLYPTEEKQPNGSTIYYFHDKPTLEESQVVFKITSQAIAISTDGGETYPTGITVNGEAIISILQTIGINADWINAGALQITDNDGNLVFLADVDTKRVYISGDYISIGDTPLIDNLNDLQNQINNIEVPESEENIYYGENLIKDPYFTKISGEGNMWAVNSGVHATRMGDDYEIKDPLGDSGKIMRIWKESTASAGVFFGTKPTDNPVIPENLRDGIFEFTFYARTENTGSGDVVWTTDIYVCVNGYYSSYKKITLNKLWHKYSIKLKCDSTRRSHISFGVAPVTSGESNAILLYKPECYYVGQDIKEGANLIRDPHFDTIKSPVSTGGMWTTPNSTGIDVRSYKTSCTHEFVNPNMDTFKDPEGGYGALVVNNMSNGVSDCFVSAISNGNNPVITDAGMYRVSVWLKAQYSGKTLKLSLNRQTTDIELSTEWKEYSYVQDVETVNTQGYEMFTIGGFGSWGTNFGNLYIYNPRVEKLYSSEDTFNMLTDFGKKKGLYKIGDQLYFSFDYARGGTLKLGGSNNGNGLLEVYNSSGSLVGRINNSGAQFWQGSEWLNIKESLLTGGHGGTQGSGGTQDGTLDLSQYKNGQYNVVMESLTGDVILKSQNEFRVERQNGGMGYLVQSGGTDYFDKPLVSYGDTYPVIGIMYGEDDISGNPFLDIRLSNGQQVNFSGGSSSSIGNMFLVRQVSGTVSQSNGYGTRTISLSYSGYEALGIVGYSVSSTYHAVYQMNFNQSAQTVTVGIRHVNDTSASSSINVYCQVLYVKSR